MKMHELVESLDSDVPYSVVKASKTTFSTSAVIGHREVVFIAHHEAYEDELEDHWSVTFQETMGNNNYTYSKTGSGNELQVFSFVIASIKELIARYSPIAIAFESENDDGNRTSLYNKLIQKVKMPGYTHSRTIQGAHSTTFIIKKIDK